MLVTGVILNHRFHPDEAYHQCPKYIVHQGHTSGCLLDAEQRDDILSFSIRHGTHPFFSVSRWIYEY
ncbi:Cytokine receptor-like factor 2, partial [Saguinus oedipus]